MRRLLFGLVLVALAGCGSPGGPKPSQATLKGEPIPLARYIARADRICADGRQQAGGKLGPLRDRLNRDGELSPDDVMLLNREGADAVRPMIDRLAALPPPDSRRAQAEDYTRAVLDTLAELDAAVAAYGDGDRDRTEAALRRNRERADDSVRAAQAVGFDICGTEFSR